ncbi:PilN domain-containing protein [Echinimonas agarilytica]|uniref:PilN domain-containing protein n=1 Tax=Echinimonas agarilytica TaxID=1215918 RepID=A0AA42B656_9GAMM|nr:PilN domain-containing protein [Echinimonas agarilytica]MCM2678340.1 PilN domain-containing protein [Echinimonas agarilytica]
MTSINLLPWREEFRQKQRQEYLSILLVASVAAVLLMLAVSSFYGSKIQTQQDRNTYLRQESAILDQKIQQLNDLKRQKQDLEQRLQLVQELQQSRNLVTQLYNVMAEIVPPGVYLTHIEKSDRELKIEGVSESNNRLAALVRNIDGVDWLDEPSIQTITMDDIRPKLLSRFVMTVQIVEAPLESSESVQGMANAN